MAISTDVLRGHTDTVILNILRQGDSYGYEITKKILEASEGRIELTGARRRYYSITQKGLATYKEHVAEWQEVNTILNSLITGDLT